MSATVQLQCLIGMQMRDFVIIAADQTNIQSIIVIKHDEEKLHRIGDRLVMGLNGSHGDITQLCQFITKNMQLYKMRNGYQLDAAATVHFIRKNLADAVHSDTPFIVNLLLAGYDNKEGGLLYTLDFLASCVKVPFAVHGFGGYLSLGILDRYYKSSLTESEAYEVLKLCVNEIHQRYILNLPNFQVKIVSKLGVKRMPTICPASFIHK